MNNEQQPLHETSRWLRLIDDEVQILKDAIDYEHEVVKKGASYFTDYDDVFMYANDGVRKARESFCGAVLDALSVDVMSYDQAIELLKKNDVRTLDDQSSEYSPLLAQFLPGSTITLKAPYFNPEDTSGIVSSPARLGLKLDYTETLRPVILLQIRVEGVDDLEIISIAKNRQTGELSTPSVTLAT